jgi:hypothetical protein
MDEALWRWATFGPPSDARAIAIKRLAIWTWDWRAGAVGNGSNPELSLSYGSSLSHRSSAPTPRACGSAPGPPWTPEQGLSEAVSEGYADRSPRKHSEQKRAWRLGVPAPFGRDLIKFSGRGRHRRPAPAPAPADEQVIVLRSLHAPSDLASGGFVSPDGGVFTTPVV